MLSQDIAPQTGRDNSKKARTRYLERARFLVLTKTNRCGNQKKLPRLFRFYLFKLGCLESFLTEYSFQFFISLHLLYFAFATVAAEKYG